MIAIALLFTGTNGTEEGSQLYLDKLVGNQVMVRENLVLMDYLWLEFICWSCS